MEKKFDEWNTSKKNIHANDRAPFCYKREIWWCALGVNVGFEQDGTGRNYDRPVVVLRVFNKNTFFAVALTGRRREGKYYLPIGNIEGTEASASLSQVKLIDTKRLIRKVSTLDKSMFEKLQHSIKAVLFE